MNDQFPNASTTQAHAHGWASEKKALYLLAGIQFTHILDFMIMMPMGPLLSRDFGLSTHEFGLLVSSYTFAAAITGLLCAFFVDRFDRKRLILVLYALFALATLACAAAPSFMGLLFARVLAGAFGGVLGALVATAVGDLVAPERRGRAMGMVSTAFALATVAGVPLGLWLANHTPILGWRSPFVLVASLALVIAILAFKRLPDHMNVPQKDRNVVAGAWARIVDTLRDPIHGWAIAFACLVMFSSFAIIPFITIYATKNVGFPEVCLPLVYLVGGVATLISSRWIGKKTDQWGKLKSFRIFMSLALIPLLLITHIGHVHMAVYLLVSTSFFVLVSGRWIPAQALVTGSAAPALRGTFMSLTASAQQAAMATAAYITGHVLGTSATGDLLGFEWAGYMSTVATLAALWLSSKVVQRA
jgi:predicted MFS family arabinose efflux permease